MMELVVAIGLVFVIEGFLYALIPDSMKNMMKFAIEQPESSLRVVGLISAAIGVFIIYVAK